ncbi:MAG: hypothetical protein U0930_09145 [Pirellulales bacterium]
MKIALVWTYFLLALLAAGGRLNGQVPPFESEVNFNYPEKIDKSIQDSRNRTEWSRIFSDGRPLDSAVSSDDRTRLNRSRVFLSKVFHDLKSELWLHSCVRAKNSDGEIILMWSVFSKGNHTGIGQSVALVFDGLELVEPGVVVTKQMEIRQGSGTSTLKLRVEYSDAIQTKSGIVCSNDEAEELAVKAIQQNSRIRGFVEMPPLVESREIILGKQLAWLVLFPVAQSTEIKHVNSLFHVWMEDDDHPASLPVVVLENGEVVESKLAIDMPAK